MTSPRWAGTESNRHSRIFNPLSFHIEYRPKGPPCENRTRLYPDRQSGVHSQRTHEGSGPGGTRTPTRRIWNPLLFR